MSDERDRRRVAWTSYTVRGQRVIVSAVWIGPRTRFETMVFGRCDLDWHQIHSATEQQALAGHQVMCERVAALWGAASVPTPTAHA
jgi:hypothetical protein